MTDTDNKNTDAVSHQILEELSEQEAQIVSGAALSEGIRTAADYFRGGGHPAALPSPPHGEIVPGTPSLHSSSQSSVAPAPPAEQGGILQKLTSNHSKVFGAQVVGGAGGSFLVGAAAGK